MWVGGVRLCGERMEVGEEGFFFIADVRLVVVRCTVSK